MRRFLLLMVLLCAGASAFAAQVPHVGQAAPAFRLQDQHGHWVTPTKFRGHWLIVYFYPKDFTPGCTAEVCTYRDDTAQLRKSGADVPGISLDDIKPHEAFSKKYDVPFPLLSDAHLEVAASYGVLESTSGMPYARRTTFLIDPHGDIAKVYTDVDPARNAGQVLSDLITLKTTARTAR